MLSSGASKIPENGDQLFSYSCGKAAMDAVSRNLASLWSIKYGVTVNSISVGATLTESLQMAMEMMGPEWKVMLENFSLLKRIGSVDEVAQIVAFVASPQASWITGNQIPANGGGLSVLQS